MSCFKFLWFVFLLFGSFSLVVTEAVSFSNYFKLHNRDNVEVVGGNAIRKLQWLDNVRFCAAPQDQDWLQGDAGFVGCNTSEYAQALVILALPGIILAGITLIVCIFYTACTFCPCCKCCFGCARKPGKPLTKKARFILYFLLFAALVVSIVGFALVMSGNSQASNAVNSMITTVQTAVDRYAVQVSNITELSRNITYLSADISLLLEDLNRSVADYRLRTQSTGNELRQMDSIRLAAIFLSSLITVVLIIIGIFFSFFKIKKGLMAITVLCFLALFVLWISLALHIMVTEMAQDVCDEISRVEERQNGTGELGYLIKCRNNDYGFSVLLEQILIAKNNTINDSCDKFNQSCNAGLSCTGAQQPCNETNLFTYPDTVTITDITYSCLVNGTPARVDSPTQCDNPNSATPVSQQVLFRDCPQQCNNTQLRANTQLVIDNLNLLQRLNRLIPEILEQLQCSFVLETFLTLKQMLCVDFVVAFQLIAAGTALMAISMSAVVILFTIRFVGIE